MKQIIIAIATITAGVGTAIILLSRSSARKTRRPRMTFAELYEDNFRNEMGGLFE